MDLPCADGWAFASSSLSHSLKQRTLTQLVEEKGEEAFFLAFEGQDAEDCRSLDKDSFVDAIAYFAPGRRSAREVRGLEEKWRHVTPFPEIFYFAGRHWCLPVAGQTKFAFLVPTYASMIAGSRTLCGFCSYGEWGSTIVRCMG